MAHGNGHSGYQSYALEVRNAGGFEPKQDFLAEELPVAMIYNGISHAVMMATPLNLEDFALGFSLTEGIINTPHQLHDIDIMESALGIEIQMGIAASAFAQLKERRRQLSGRSGCGICGLDSLKALTPSAAQVQPSDLPDYNTVAGAIANMHRQQQLHKQCGAVHAAALVDDHGNIISLREDVGRHNALDKLLGATAAQDKARCFILISSRSSYEMVIKAASQGISTLVSVSAPTTMALELARQANMNLIGFVRDTKQVIYNRTKPEN